MVVVAQVLLANRVLSNTRAAQTADPDSDTGQRTTLNLSTLSREFQSGAQGTNLMCLQKDDKSSESPHKQTSKGLCDVSEPTVFAER